MKKVHIFINRDVAYADVGQEQGYLEGVWANVIKVERASDNYIVYTDYVNPYRDSVRPVQFFLSRENFARLQVL